MRVQDAVLRREELGREILRWSRIGWAAQEKLNLIPFGDSAKRRARRERLAARVQEAMDKVAELSRERQTILMEID